jgi:hypothetical protein
MVIRLSTETEEEFSDLKSELDKVQVHDIRSSFYYSWASQSILYKNISVAFEPRLSTAKVVKITAAYGEGLLLIVCIIYPRYRGTDKSLARPGRKRLTGHLQPRRNWTTWASDILIIHSILRIWPRRTTTCSLD